MWCLAYRCARAGASVAGRSSCSLRARAARPTVRPNSSRRTRPGVALVIRESTTVARFQTPNMASSSAKASVLPEPDCVFHGSSAAELDAWLQRQGVDTTAYGRGPAKSVAQLFEEVQLGESQLRVEGGDLRRIVSVLNVFIENSSGQVLMEEHQVRPCGTVRARGLPLSEKLKGGEEWQPAVLRAVTEELGSVLPPSPKVETLTHTYRMEVETKTSNSYPQLYSVVSARTRPASEYHCHRVQAKVEGLPQTKRFVSTEPRPEGTLENHWIWQPSPA